MMKCETEASEKNVHCNDSLTETMMNHAGVVGIVTR